jgi:hypothetical protein
MKKQKEDLPDLHCADVANAAVKIQAAYRGFQARQKVKHPNDDLPDLNCADVAHAALKIQSVYRGFTARQKLKSSDPVPPNSALVSKTQAERLGGKYADGRKIVRGPALPGNLVVDERDSKKGKRSSFLVSEAPLEEKPSQELLRHPGKLLDNLLIQAMYL